MSKKTNNKEDNIEKELIKRIEDNKSKNSNSQVKKEPEIKYENEMIEDGSNNQTLDETIKVDSNSPIFNKKTNYYNEKVGVYNYLFNTTYNSTQPRKFKKMSQISKHLLNAESTFKNIIQFKKSPELNNSESFNYRIFKYLDNYSDLILSHSDLQIRQQLMNVYLFHIVNHFLKRNEEIEINNKIQNLIELSTKQKYCEETMIKNDLFINEDDEYLKKYFKESELKNFPEGYEEYFEEFKLQRKFKENHTYSVDDYDKIRDQGFTTPRVLILLPNKKHARLVLEEIISIMGIGWKGVSNKKKFQEEFSEAESMGDCFRIGINFDFSNNKIKLYQPFESSDIIIASPLGLKLTTQNDESVKNKKVYDFLSSIEILLVDFSEVFIYQNLEHLEEILQFMNKPPKNNQNIVNINRIKESVANNSLQYLRQNIVISHFKNLEIELLIRNYCKNVKGGMYWINEHYESAVDNVNSKIANRIAENHEYTDKSNMVVKYEFKMLKTFDDLEICDHKFNYFTKNLWQSLYETFDRHTIIFASSALDYVRLKNFFKKNSVTVTFLSEDTDKKDWQRNRLFFEEGRLKFLLYSERAHFYKKINLKFAKNIFFYSLPEDPAIFAEMIELIAPDHYKASLEKYKIEDKNSLAENYSAVIALVSKMDKYSLEKIVGTNTTSYIFKNKLDNFVC